ncbi:hypothetical protein O1L60_14225 [Streptomyces diastatochromogenes]|nr:hypothetical protein [Streptomyces diastatochromogenes]
MNAQAGRRLGILLGVGLACALVPGIAVRGEETVDTLFSVLTAALVMTVLTQVVFIGPSGRVPPRPPPLRPRRLHPGRPDLVAPPGSAPRSATSASTASPRSSSPP